MSYSVKDMNAPFFAGKIKKLTDDRLTDLLKIKHTANKEIIQLARAEAERRNLAVNFSDAALITDPPDKREEWLRLTKWNWAVLLITASWVLTSGLEKGALVYFIPGVNFVAIFLPGFNGNVGGG